MPRFVVLLHETPVGYPRPTHFDVMLEHGGALHTWAMEKLPVAGESVSAERLADHRLAYLDYEGEVTGDRGRVSRFDGGPFESSTHTATAMTVQLQGENLRGTLSLTRDDQPPHRWRVSFSPG